MDINEILVAVGALIAGVFGMWGVIVKLTKSTKDDEVFDKVNEKARPILDKLSKP